MAMLLCGNAHADDDDDDDDDSGSSSRSSNSDVETWPPTAVNWPPLFPDDADDDAVPIVIVGPALVVPTGAPTVPSTTGGVMPIPIVVAAQPES